jgi:glycosyltransferase involved in cell wall biosynthesis
MRVAILTRDYPPAIGGVATHVDGIVKALKGLGVDVDVFVGWNNYRTVLLPLTKSLRQYDLVHVQSSPYGALVIGVPMVVTVHAPVLTEWGHYSTMYKFVSVPALLCEEASLNRARAVLAVSEVTKSDLVRKYRIAAEKVDVIGNGVSFEKFALTDRKDHRAANRILMVSRLEPRKRVEDALVAMSRLDPKSYEVQIAGDGSQRKGLERLARKLGVNARFLGRVGEEELPSLYRQAGVFLTTSASEGFGLSLLEAMASGCGIIASNIPTHSTLLKNGDAGLVYYRREELETKLRLLVGDTDLITSLGARAQVLARGYSWDEVAKRVRRVYDSVLRGAS